MCDMGQTQTTLAGRADEMISAAVRGLMAQRRINAARVALAVGVSRAALYRKLSNDSPWQAEEVDRMARFFEVTRDSLYEGRADFAAAPGTVTDAPALVAQRIEHLTTDHNVEGSPPRHRTGRRRTDRPQHQHLFLVAAAS